MLCKVCRDPHAAEVEAGEVIEIKPSEINDFVHTIYERLRVKNERMVSVLDDLYNFKEQET
jgi:predicted AAA+ superfamily ATPase